MRIFLEILLALSCLFLSSMWWALMKRDFFVRDAIRDGTLLSVLTREQFEKPPPQIKVYTTKHDRGYVMNLRLLLKADRRALRIPKLLFGVPLALLLIGSYTLGWTIFAINLGLFGLAGLQRVPESAKANALEQVISIGVILYRWNAEDPAECRAFITKAHTLSNLYATVLAVSGSTASSASS
jgi:hypothetical protein